MNPVAGLILAAGESKRMGAPKALLEFRGATFLDRLISVFSEHCCDVVVVLGYQAEVIRRGLRLSGQAHFVRNIDYQRGQLSSMQCGIREIPVTAEHILFTLVDHPSVEPATVMQLLEHPRALVTIPRYEGRRGHPVLLSRDLIPEFLALPPDGQARTVIHAHAGETRYVDIDDPGILDDIDDPAAYERLLHGVRV